MNVRHLNIYKIDLIKAYYTLFKHVFTNAVNQSVVFSVLCFAAKVVNCVIEETRKKNNNYKTSIFLPLLPDNE